MKIHVTQDDIAQGVCGHAKRCAVALALMRETGYKFASVDSDSVLFWNTFNDANVCVALPEEVGRFVGKFDAGGKVEPFDFLLEVPA